jgi:hypothetical protein
MAHTHLEARYAVLAVMLSPVLLQQVECSGGDTRLLSLALEVEGENEIDFSITELLYDLSVQSDSAVLSVEPRDPAASTDYQWWANGAFSEGGKIGVGGGEVTLSIPPGQSQLRIYVRAPEGAYGYYSIDVDGVSDHSVAILSPLQDERFVVGEPMALTASITGAGTLDESDVSWTSDLDGFLGTGTSLSVSTLSEGTHLLEVALPDTNASTQVRVFSDLGNLFAAPPASAEIARIRSDFQVRYVDGAGPDESWALYAPPAFDPSSSDPNELVVIAALDVLRHQRFSEPLPFTNAATIYDHVRAHVDRFNLFLQCRYASGGGGAINYGWNMSVWDSRTTGSSGDSCKEPPPNAQPRPYSGWLGLTVHEARHSEPDDPGHISSCASFPTDLELEGGSGYAQDALYAMWVYKYGIYDPPEVKDAARLSASSLLRFRICSTPTHSNPLVQAIIDELYVP